MDKLKWTKGERGWLGTGLYVTRDAYGKKYLVECLPEEGKKVLWNPAKDYLICGPIDIADPDPELELPEGWAAPLDGPFVRVLWRIAARKGPEGQVCLAGVEVDHPDRARCVRAVNAAVKALEGE